MARIPDEELARLKREVDLVALVEAAGIELRRQGRDWVGLCKWHEDREPSFIVSPEKAPPLWHCLGACQAGGTAIDFLMKQEGLAFREAVSRLQEIVGGNPIGGPVETPGSSPAEAPPGDLVLDHWMDDRQLWDRTVGYYTETFWRKREPQAYMERRGLLSRPMLERFEVGYSDRTLARHMPPRQSKPGQRFRSRLMELGIMRPSSGQEHMWGRVVVPVRDESELVVGMYGHTTDTKLDPAVTPKHFYLPGPRRGVLNWKCLLEHTEVILCEAPFDAMTFAAAGYANVTSSWGANGFTDEHLSTLLRHGVERVLIAYDRDEAGEKGAAKVAERLLAEGVECFRVLLPRGMDVNQYASRVKPAGKSLGLAIRQARWMGKGRPPAASTVVLAGATAEPERKAARKEKAAQAPPVDGPSSGAALPVAEEPVTLGEIAARAAAQEKLASSLAAIAACPPAEPAASPAPPAPAADVPVEVHGEEVVLWLGDRRYRVRGLAKNLSHDLLKVNLLASRGEALHVDTFDLYSARARMPFVKQAAAELGVAEDVVRHDLQRVLLRLELLQRERIEAELAPAPAGPVMTPEEREEALAMGQAPSLVETILADCKRCGLVGEETNALVAYLTAVSAKLERPLAVIIQSSSAAGKSALMEAILAFFPEESRIKYAAMTGQSLYYMTEQDLRHKVLAIVEEEGAERAAYALKLLLSEGELTIASTGKDPASGRLVTHEYRVEGPISVFLTTTSVEIDEELQNRAIVLTVDESREQTRAIHAMQREEETLAGYWAREERKAILARHRNFHRLLRPLVVINPHVEALSFQDSQTRSRRDHKKYLTLIRAIALLHQHQRPTRRERRGDREVEALEVTPEDVALANRLAHEVLGRSLDELAPQTRRLLELLHRHVGAECQRLGIEQSAFLFLLREAREWTGFGQTQLKVHMARLVDLEYVVVHRGGRGQSFLYELVYAGEGADGARFVPGLERRALRSAGDRSGANGTRSAWNHERSGSNRGRVGPESGGGRAVDFSSKSKDSRSLPKPNGKDPENAAPGSEEMPRRRASQGR
jgi:DNA primase